MVLIRTLYALAVFVGFLSAMPLSAHSPPTPLQALHGGVVSQIDRLRIELVVHERELQLTIRNLHDSPMRLASASVKAWSAAGLTDIPFRISGGVGTGLLPPELAPQRYIITLKPEGQSTRRLTVRHPN